MPDGVVERLTDGGWLAVAALALAAFALAAFLLRLPREGLTLFGAVLVFGLAGYAWQGSPGQPSAPKPAAARTLLILCKSATGGSFSGGILFVGDFLRGDAWGSELGLALRGDMANVP